jgi:LuxR family transcriptional regulator, maltose regulon positive regulatory protein
MAQQACASEVVPPLTGRTLGARDVLLLRLLTEGRSTREIAEALAVSRNTARTRIRRVQGKLRVGDRTGAVQAAGGIGLVPTPRAAPA